MRTDYISRQVIEENCNCAGVFIVKETDDGENGTSKSPAADSIMGSSSMWSVLLVESKRKNYQYSFPKGKRNKGESTLEAAKRELYEETGLKEQDYDLYPEKWYIEYRADTGKPHIVYYMAKIKNSNVVLNPIDKKEIVSAGWFTPDEIYTMRRSFYLQRRQIVTRAIRDCQMRMMVKQGRHLYDGNGLHLGNVDGRKEHATMASQSMSSTAG